jgi:hypothetical protein
MYNDINRSLFIIMQNNTITSVGEIQSPSAPAEHRAMLPVLSEPRREFSSLTTRPYFSMPNIAVMYSAANDRSENEYSEFSGLTKRQYCSMPNIAVVCGAGDAIELQSPSSRASTRPVSVDPAKRDVASGVSTGPPKKSCGSVPKINVTFSATEATGFECIPVKTSAEVLNGLSISADVQTSSDSITSRGAEIEFKVTTTQRLNAGAVRGGNAPKNSSVGCFVMRNIGI